MIESLENNEHVLLMYLAGELPPVDRQEVEQMLAGDAGLRRELERLQSMQEEVENRFATLDHDEPLASEAAGVRRIGRAMRQHLAQRAADAARTPLPAQRKLVLAWWAYPSIAAAAIFLAFLTWVINYNHTDHGTATGPSTNPPVAVAVAVAVAPDIAPANASSTSGEDHNSAQLAQEIESSFGPSAEPEDTKMFALRDDPQVALWSDKDE